MGQIGTKRLHEFVCRFGFSPFKSPLAISKIRGKKLLEFEFIAQNSHMMDMRICKIYQLKSVLFDDLKQLYFFTLEA